MQEKVTIRILMTDDHPIIIEGYQMTLKATKKEHQTLIIDIANSCDESLNYMNEAYESNKPYDVLFMDISLPPSKDGKYTSGEDLARHARKIMPQSKLVILTMFNEPYRVHNIIKTINPEGFLIKSDLTSSELASAFQAIINNPPFYSGTVNSILRKSISNDLGIDDTNRKILHLLAQGVKTKSLVEHISLSMSAIEKRKKHLKELFDVVDGNDEALLEEAKKKGFV
ncbi:DNA-binding response regulator [Mangrovimonas sp. AS39]|uniref:DNA-binding response regulator n=1 Tax=Mangrovimonas futianensis TaxID=2895523 RepID=UPI001E2C98C1|nr:DNA-binding response regulator [Mangrovimonas futianensis]MCF1190972.1 DNA-binding response regulator [Mangrovimonas futianensis]MCF1194668.1 DNA-binding response regulator [Mangrovimonas futianensis]